MVGAVLTSSVVCSSLIFSGLLGLGSSKIMLSWTEAKVSTNSSLRYGESCLKLTSALGCGCGEPYVVSLIGLWLDGYMKCWSQESPTNVCEENFHKESNEGYLVIFMLHSFSFLLFPKKEKIVSQSPN